MNPTENQNTAEHDWFKDQIAAKLLGGLDGEDLSRFESHAQSCRECAAELESAIALDRDAKNLLAGAMPADLEDRITRRLRLAEGPKKNFLPAMRFNRVFKIHPSVRRAAVAAAAIIVIGGVGFIGNEWLTNGRLPSFQYAKSRGYEAMGQIQLQPPSKFAGVGSPQQETQAPLLHTRLFDKELAKNKDNHDRDGQNVLYDDGHVEFQANPFVGIQKDQLTQGGAAASAGALKGSYDGCDTVLLPTDDGDGIVDSEKPQRFKPAEFAAGYAQPRLKEAQDKLADAAKPQAAQVAANAPGDGKDPGKKPPAREDQPVASDRKIIRNGEMEFEVESFDTSYILVSKIVEEERGFIASTDSEKLPNGKVKGVIVVRVPPAGLDVLVLKLRGLGDLRNQKLTSQDVTKQYVDLESQLRASRAMEGRLLDMIKSQQGSIKDLLAAEKELGVWREKIERLQGEINFYNNQVALSTLSISLFEKDVKSPTSATENETVNMGIEIEEVEKARDEAMKAIDDAKGRIVAAELKKFEGGQLAASITADVPFESAGPVIDRLKQLGKVARLDISRQQNTKGGTGAPTNVRVERKDTRLIVSMYNLANVAPRRTVNLNLAAEDVENSYKSILDLVAQGSGRVVFSNLSRPAPDRVSGAINFEIADGSADAVLAQIRGAGEVLSMNATENPDANNVTTAKRGFAIQLVALSQVPPREVVAMTVETSDVDAAMRDLSDKVKEIGGRTLDSQQSTQRDGSAIGRITVDLPIEKSAEFLSRAKSAGIVRAMESNRNPQAPQGPLAKMRIDLTFANGDRIVASDSGFWATVRGGVSTSVAGLLWSLRFIVIGLCFVLPWWMLLWGVRKVWKRPAKVS